VSRIAFAALFFAATAAGAAPLRVVATIEPLAMLVRAIGGERVVVDVLVPSGASPHTFEPQPSDVAALAKAALLAEIGGDLDAWVARLAAASDPAPPKFTALAAPGLDALPSGDAHGGGAHALDPHVWLDPLRVRDAIVPALADRLASLDPEGRAAYEASARALGDELTALDAEIRRTLDGRDRRFVAFHAAWRYFADRYGLQEIGVVEEAPGEEPGPKQLATLVERARAAGVPAILVEPQLSPRVARTLAAEFGATTVLVDPNGDPRDPERDTFVELLRFDAQAFAQALGAARP
jgi:ABC-type Zn uptake system ZnuABC Zn-binding protein ZnuA